MLWTMTAGQRLVLTKGDGSASLPSPGAVVRVAVRLHDRCAVDGGGLPRPDTVPRAQRPDHVTLWRFYNRHRLGSCSSARCRRRSRWTLWSWRCRRWTTKVRANASKDRTYDAGGLRRLLGRLEGAIDELEAQNEAGEEPASGHLPETLHDRKVLREQVRETMSKLAGREGQKHINLTDQDARMMKTRQGFAVAYNAQARCLRWM